MLEKDPKKRISFQNILNHQIFELNSDIVEEENNKNKKFKEKLSIRKSKISLINENQVIFICFFN